MRNAAPPENPADEGHHVRFWVARDREGKIIPDTYIMAMDYAGINYDYQDNVYLVSNIKPETPPTAPTGALATSSGAGTMLTWTANSACRKPSRPSGRSLPTAHLPPRPPRCAR